MPPCRTPTKTTLPWDLPRVEEVVVRGVRHARLRAGAAAFSGGSDPAGGRDALDAGHIAEVAAAAHGLRAEQKPRNSAGGRRIGAALHRADDLAAIPDGFPLRPCVVAADEVGALVVEIGLRRDEHPLLVAALVDLHPLRADDALQRFAGAGAEVLRYRLQILRNRRARRAAGQEQYEQ